MDLKEIKEFFDEVDKIPQEKKDGITKFLFGVSLLSSNPNKLSDLLFAEKDFDELYQEFIDSVEQDENLVEKDRILKRVADEKELIEKIHDYYKLKAEVGKTLEPMGLFGSIMQSNGGIGSMGFFLLMSFLAISRDNIKPESLAMNTSAL